MVFGTTVGILALTGAAGAYRMEWLSSLIAVWLVVAAFTIDDTTAASWNDIILGLIIFVLAVAIAGSHRPRTRPWRGPPVSSRNNDA